MSKFVQLSNGRPVTKESDTEAEGISALTMGANVTVNWASSSYFTGQIDQNSTFSFSNTTNGRTITIIIQGHASNDYTITFPSMIKRTDFVALVKANKYNVYTITKSGGNFFASSIEDMA